MAGNVLPSYEVAGDWFDVVENLDGVWITLADGLGPSTRAAASSAVALGALRASRRSGGSDRTTRSCSCTARCARCPARAPR